MLSTQIKALRRRKGWSQAELARRLHISPSTIGMYEQGRREPSIETLVALSKEFNVTIDYLVSENYGVNFDQESIARQKCFTKAMPGIRNISHDELLPQ